MMYYIRQIFFTIIEGNNENKILNEIKSLIRIPNINKHVLAKKAINQNYIYLQKDYDYTLILYFCNQNDIDKYILHTLHQNFVVKVANLVRMQVYDYVSID